MKAAILLMSFIIFSVSGSLAATATYASLPYRSTGDSPFLSSILSGGTFVEDFEDQLLDPNLVLPFGRVSTTGRNSVDFDDGRMDNLGVGYHWLVEGSLLPGDSMFTNEIRFVRNVSGSYPSHAGLAFLGFLTSSSGQTRFFQAFDEAGVEIPGAFLSALIPEYPGVSNSSSTLGDRFFGLIYENGISKIKLNGTRIDHIQFGYGVIPEPGTAALALLSAWQLVGRRRRTTPSP